MFSSRTWALFEKGLAGGEGEGLGDEATDEEADELLSEEAEREKRSPAFV